MAGINKVILVGNLGKDPEVRTTETGIKVAHFTLATTEVYKDKNGERKEITEWHNIVCWRNLADISEKYLTKGKLIYVEGKLRTRSWEENGVKRYTTEVVADNFIMLGAKNDNVSHIETPASPQAATTSTVAPTASTASTTEDPVLPPFISEEDDLPF
ncbi:MAG: single-stranded DNA-binding protein [Bacteroidales bacterium]|jgi:single-strand DNA-binding protein|nr:single-stranded DNA-binding protein [Bacteroidales bacterium]